MAITKNGILGGFSGKIGNVVGVQLNGENILRAAPRPSKNPPSEKQRLQRLKFSLAIEFTQPFMGITERFFLENATTGERKNKIISYVLNHVLLIHEQEFTIEWSKFLLSCGTLSGFHQLESQVTDQELTLHWQDNTHQGFAHPEDEVNLLIATESLEHILFLEKIAVRRDLQTKITFPQWAETEAIHCYIFLSNPRNQQSSNSFYLGKYQTLLL